MGRARDEAGNIWETDAQGNPVRLLSAAGAPQGEVFTLPPDAGQQATINRTQTQTEIDQAKAPGEIAQIQANATKTGLEIEKLRRELGSLTQDQRTGAKQDATLDSIVEQINRVQELYNSGISQESKSNLWGLLDNVGPEAGRFNSAGQGVADQGLAAFRVPGVGSQSDLEAAQFASANTPQASDWDASIEEKLSNVRRRIDSNRRALGLPPAQWTGLPATQEERQDNRPNPMTQIRIGGNGGSGTAPFGSAQGNTSTPPPELVSAQSQLVAQLLAENNGRLDPDKYAREFQRITRGYPGFDTDPASSAQWARDVNGYLDRGGKTIPSGVQMRDRELSAVERFRNDLVNNPLGAAAVGFADAGGFGGVSALAPDQMAALSNEQQVPMLLGQVAGSLTGTGALKRLGGAALARTPQAVTSAAQRLPAFQRLATSPFARNLAADATYGGIYGGVSEGDPVTGAVSAGIGSAAGQGVGSALGRAVSGVTSSPTVARLYGQGIIPTIGQIARGRAADAGGKSYVAGIEDTVANSGFLGHFVNNARMRTLEQANLAGFNIAGRGAPVTDISEAGLNQLHTIKDAAFDDALNGVSVPRNDPTFVADVNAAGARGAAVDAARGRGDFSFIMDQELRPIVGSGPDISGNQLQDALRLLQGRSRAYNKAATGPSPDPAASGVSSALNDVSTALTDLAGNYSPDTLPQLREANAIYRGMNVLDDAAQRARNEGGVWTGAQLGDAIRANNSQFGQRGFSSMSDSPFFQLQQDMTAVLPNKIPPTGVNAAPMLALGSAALGGAGYATDNDYLKGAAVLGLGALPYTRAGQRAIAASVLARPARVQMLGNAIRRKAGIFGSASLPLMLDY